LRIEWLPNSYWFHRPTAAFRGSNGAAGTGLTNEQLLLEREAFLVDSVENNSSALNIANLQYEAGALDFPSVLQLQTRTLNPQITLVRIQNTRLAQRLDLHLALGGSFGEEL
jgi:multidrug efflux system outer membrane protein